MATTEVIPGGDAIVTEIHIAAPPQRVFQALVAPEQVLQWWDRTGFIGVRNSAQTCAWVANGKAPEWGPTAAISRLPANIWKSIRRGFWFALG